MVRGAKSILELRRATETIDSVGSPTTVWTALRSCKGVLMAAYQGSENILRDKQTVQSTHRFYLDYPLGITVSAKDLFVELSTEDKYQPLYVDDAMNQQRFNVIELLKQV